MSGAIEELTHEHRIIKRVVKAMERATETLRTGEQLPPEFFEGVIEFVTGFTDGCHHRKEEHALFPLLAAKGEKIRTGPVKVLLGEHEIGRHFVRVLRAAITRMEQGDKSAHPAAAEALAGYTRTLRNHIAKEDEVVFRLAGCLLSPEEMGLLSGRFSEIEQDEVGLGAHERYERLSTRIEELAAGLIDVSSQER
jgi:hemerythrin-like domain-containing protein